MRIFIKIEYDGTNYCGWQIQPNGISVQQKIENAVLLLTGENVSVVGSGRTDSGVHALGQVAHFDTESNIPPSRFSSALNQFLPDDIKVMESYQVDSDMHARFSAKHKTYQYRIYISKHPRPLMDRYSARVEFPLDISAMQKASQKFVGKHDFACFLASGSEVKDTVREIYFSKVEKIGEEILFTVCGNGFLYNMVRIMAGTLVKVGAGKLSPDDIDQILISGDRKKAGITMQAQGLTLVSVDYE
ncbi:MAG: tRNA pseudouridine(38-40) synthase TruA [Clostridia bacterium]|nr:tRNA pseudouridine(38-40) synthase TruA [Clostridia bacterium]